MLLITIENKNSSFDLLHNTFKPGLESQIAVFRNWKYQTSNENFILRLSQAGMVQPVLRSHALI